MEIDRETFMHNVDIEGEDIIDAFENLMALYCIYNSIGKYDNIKVSMTSSELASFDLILDTVKNANDIMLKCNRLHVTIYDKQYYICCTNDNNIVHITLYNQS